MAIEDLIVTGTDINDQPVGYEYRGFAIGSHHNADGDLVGWIVLIGSGRMGDDYPFVKTLDEAMAVVDGSLRRGKGKA